MSSIKPAQSLIASQLCFRVYNTKPAQPLIYLTTKKLMFRVTLNGKNGINQILSSIKKQRKL